jgi:hypothetical protein
MNPKATFAIALIVAIQSVGTVAAQVGVSRCADCHVANPRSVSAWHLSEWDHSRHRRAGVGCEACHSGNAGTFDSFPAHRGMLRGRDPASPIHRMNIPKTCGVCHPGPLEAFKQSKHYELLREGNRATPTCTTCHGDAGGYLPSPKALAAECLRCHGLGKVAPRTDYPPDGRIHLAKVHEVRQSLNRAAALIKRVEEKARRMRLELELQDARDSLAEAVHAAHMFVFDKMDERLRVARKRAELLLEEIARPQL